jgi:ribosomal protein S4E
LVAASNQSGNVPLIQRIVSKNFHNGQYYNEKCIIQDVTRSKECILKTAAGKVLDAVKQQYLETVIPKVEKYVMIIGGDHEELVGQIGKLIQYDSGTEKAIVQMDSTYEMETFGFDDISEYIDHY